METGTLVRAIHHKGVLRLLSPVSLPEDAQVSVIVFQRPLEQVTPEAVAASHPTRLVPAERLDLLTGKVALGGDALADSEALYD